MGFWNDGVRSRSRSRSRSPSRHKRRATSAQGGVYSRPTAARSASSFLESITGYSQASRSATPRRADSSYGHGHGHSSSGRDRGIFGFGSSTNSGYSSRARPRKGLVAKLRRWLRDLYYYMKRHPVKVFFLVIMPLITGGALTKILATVGVRLPPSLERMVGSNMNRGFGQSERFYARGGARDFGGGTNLPGMDGGGGLGALADSAGGLMKIAKMFM